ncbi:hypothetical protein J4E86_011164 [Alternaria arbusti]|uniref:uncharacterized protein n=1 Tax=Alternaria arbusti TaxID=232088 RepID=UPI00221EFCFC|nr:uncharacterized protein J4E86_011164 [Alternaria arbusti]KAI4940198.1 hypothetical protein J4E86_011164 [Alternaria arbusti]
MAMSKYETIMWEGKMKEQILDHAHALYVEKYPAGSVFNVIHATTTDDKGYIKKGATLIETHLVVYKDPSTAQKWELIFSIAKLTVEEGLEAVLGHLRGRLSEKTNRDMESSLKAFAKSLVESARLHAWTSNQTFGDRKGMTKRMDVELLSLHTQQP